MKLKEPIILAYLMIVDCICLYIILNKYGHAHYNIYINHIITIRFETDNRDYLLPSETDFEN